MNSPPRVVTLEQPVAEHLPGRLVLRGGEHRVDQRARGLLVDLGRCIAAPQEGLARRWLASQCPKRPLELTNMLRCLGVDRGQLQAIDELRELLLQKIGGRDRVPGEVLKPDLKRLRLAGVLISLQQANDLGPKPRPRPKAHHAHHRDELHRDARIGGARLEVLQACLHQVSRRQIDPLEQPPQIGRSPQGRHVQPGLMKSAALSGDRRKAARDQRAQALGQLRGRRRGHLAPGGQQMVQRLRPAISLKVFQR